MKRRTTEQLVEELKEVYKGKKYSFEKTIFTRMNDKITITCHEKDDYGVEHGDFSKRAASAINGFGCPKCGQRTRITTTDFIRKANIVHKNFYSYEKALYENTQKRIVITCPIHGDFEQNPYWHLRGAGCPKCHGGTRMSKEEFIEKARSIHGDLYSYDNSHYDGARKKIAITCRRHGIFWQTPYVHLRGSGCPQCSMSVLERDITNMLGYEKIDHSTQYILNENKGFRFDIYIPSLKLAIECQGEQHYTPVAFHHATKEEIEKEFQRRILRDREKYNYAKENGVEVIYYTRPSMFSSKININDGFYSDKIVLTGKRSVLSYILGKQKAPSRTEISEFHYDALNKVSNDFIMGGEARIKNRMGVILFIDPHNPPKYKLSDTLRNYKRDNVKSVIVFNNEYKTRKDAVLCILKHYFCPSTAKPVKENVFVSEIKKNVASDFWNKYHFSSYGDATLCLGAFVENKIVGVSIFNQSKNNLNEWNLIGFSVKWDEPYIGICDFLFNYFVNNYQYKKISHFSDRRWVWDEENNIYTKLGFKMSHKTNPQVINENGLKDCGTIEYLTIRKNTPQWYDSRWQTRISDLQGAT